MSSGGRADLTRTLDVDALGSSLASGHADEDRYFCPFCPSVRGSEDHSGHLYVNTRKRMWICHRCGSKGRLDRSDVLAPVDPSRWSKVVDYTRYGAPPIPTTPSSALAVPECVPVREETSAARYLQSRGYGPDIWYSYNIHDWRDRRRVVIPIYMDRKLVYWVARTYTDAQPKYLNPTNVSKSVLFNYDTLKYGDPDASVVIVEGVTSAISQGIYAIATLGKYVSSKQISDLLSLPQRTFVCMLDGDAQKENLSLAKRIWSRAGRKSVQVKLATLRSKEDPASITEDRRREVLSTLIDVNSEVELSLARSKL